MHPRGLYYVIGHQQETRKCPECEERPIRISVQTGRHPNGGLKPVVRVCLHCALELIGDVVNMMQAMLPKPSPSKSRSRRAPRQSKKTRKA